MNPTKTYNWKKINKYFIKIKEEISIKKLFKKDKNRFNKFSINFNNLLLLDYSKNLINNKIIKLLINLAKECKLKKKINLLFNGNFKNTTENNNVLYPVLRNFKENNIINKDVDKCLKKIESFCKNLNKNWLGFTNKKIKNIINIGIGGSDLGIKMVIESLNVYKNKKLFIHFVSNIHGENLSNILKKINPDNSLFIISSKSFKTKETLINAENAKNWFLNKTNFNGNINKHFLIISSNKESYKQFGIDKNNFFKMFDWVNGRFSIWSSIGLVISLIIGFKNFKSLLKGANSMDNHFRYSDFNKNIPVILSLISIWYNNFFKFETESIIPYNWNLSNFGLYYQQLSMESNGKSVDNYFNFINNYKTGNISFGGVGTDSQHSFFQFMHQGTKTIPCDLILSANTSRNDFFKKDYIKLVSNCLAQSKALAFGNFNKNIENYKICIGNKPNNVIFLKNINPFTLGMLISMYENKIFSQGAILNICSFDQWGVEIGKKLSSDIEKIIINNNNKFNYDSSTKNLINLYKNWNK